MTRLGFICMALEAADETSAALNGCRGADKYLPQVRRKRAAFVAAARPANMPPCPVMNYPTFITEV